MTPYKNTLTDFGLIILLLFHRAHLETKTFRDDISEYTWHYNFEKSLSVESLESYKQV